MGEGWEAPMWGMAGPIVQGLGARRAAEVWKLGCNVVILHFGRHPRACVESGWGRSSDLGQRQMITVI